MKCPQCNSTNTFTGKKGFGYGRAAVGGLLVGPIGILLGGTGKDRIHVICMDCGHKWDHTAVLEEVKRKEELKRINDQNKQLWEEAKSNWKKFLHL